MATVNTHHPDYDKMLDRWQTCDDAADGQHAIHKAGVKYLPRLKDQSTEDYKSYKERALFYNATWRTIAGLQGLLFRKPPVMEVSSQVEPLIDDITMDGQSLYDFAYGLSEETLELGRAGILVAYPEQSTEGLTLADVSALNLRPYLKCYEAESIINWKTGIVNNINVLTMVVLTEDFEIVKNEFKSECEIRYRVLDLIDGRFRVRVFRIDDRDNDELISESYPVMNGKYLDYIPFIFVGTDSLTPDVEAPPLIDLVYANISHYKTTADYEHACHFTGLPTPVISGYTRENESDKLYIGSTSAWVFPDPKAKASYLEFSGQGLGALENNLTRKEQMMAILGARMLSSDKKGVEAADTASIHRSGENSVLSGISQTLTKALTKALQIMDIWLGGTGESYIELNTDFLGMPLNAQELTALVGAWQSGAISQETLFNNLKRGELYSDSETFEEEQAKIDTNPTLVMP